MIIAGRNKIHSLLCIFMLLIFFSFAGPVAAVSLPRSVPLPNSADGARLFFDLINEHRVQEAVNMMDESMLTSPEVKQVWEQSLNTISSVKMTRLLKWEPANWNDTIHKYKITLHVTLKPGVPFRGWENGENTRWVTMRRIGQLWKIHEIATGP